MECENNDNGEHKKEKKGEKDGTEDKMDEDVTVEQLEQKKQDQAKTKTMIEAVEQQIKDTESAIEEKAKTEREKKLATKYHMIKFVERQRLTRMERRALKNLAEAKAAADFEDVAKYSAELQTIGLDQLYVAHFPNHLKYMALFGKDGVRIIDGDEKSRKKREDVRVGIWDRVRSGEIAAGGESKGWVNMEFLDLAKERPMVVEEKGRAVMMDTGEKGKGISTDGDGDEKQQRTNDTNNRNDHTPSKSKQKDVNDASNGDVGDASDSDSSSSSSSAPSESSSDEDDTLIKGKRNNVTAARKTKVSVSESSSDEDDTLDKGKRNNVTAARTTKVSVENTSHGNIVDVSKPSSSSNSSNTSISASNKSVSSIGSKGDGKGSTKDTKRASVAAIKSESSSSDDDSDSSDSDSNSSDSDSDSSDSDSDSSSDSDNSTSDSDEEDNRKRTSSVHITNGLAATIDVVTDKEEDEKDDFLVDDDEDADIMKAFAKATSNSMSNTGKRGGDKSKGWQTQRQKPGEWKRPKRRV